MRKLLPFLGLLLCSYAWAAAPTIVQKSPNTCFAVNVASTTCSFASNLTASNMLIACIGTAQNQTVNTPTMTGETLAKVSGMSNAGTAGNGQLACYASNSVAGGHLQLSVSVTPGPADIHVHMVELSGQAASPQDATGNAESATLSVATSASTTTASDLVLGFCYDDANNHTITPGTGYATVQQTNNSTTGDVMYSESKTVSATGTQTATASGNVGDTVEQGIIAVAGSAGGGSSCTSKVTLKGVGCI